MRKIYPWITMIVISAVLGMFAGTYLTEKRNSLISGTVEGLTNTTKNTDFVDINAQFEGLKEEITQYRGTYSLYVKDLDTMRVYSHNSSQRFYGASLYKLLVATATLRKVDQKELDLSYVYMYEGEDRAWGTGSIQQYPKDTRFTLEFLLDLLLRESDNTAQNIIVDLIGKGYVSSVFKEIMGSYSDFSGSNITNTKEVSLFLERIYLTNILRSKDMFFNIMKKTSFDNRIDAGLRKDLSFSHKIGSWGTTGSWHDCGIVFGQTKEVIVCLMSKDTNFEDFSEVANSVGKFISILFE